MSPAPVTFRVIYVVVDSDGVPRRNKRGGLKAYTNKRKAEHGCLYEGDSVVQAIIHLDVEPLFIRRRVL